MRISPRWICILSLVPTVCLFAGGCGSEKKTLSVTGTVRQAGKPVADIYLNFVPSRGRPSWGVTDKEGNFTLKYDRETEGAEPGKHKVYFEFRPRDPKQEMAYREGTYQLPSGVQTILKKYSRENSTLTYDIVSDGQVIAIDLD